MATDPLTLLAQSNCYACFGIGGTWRVLELSLLRQWAIQSAVIPVQAETTAWVARVQANGGGTPSTKSQNAINTFVFALKQAGILSKMIHVNCIAGDNYITATTPLIVGPGGFNQWSDILGDLQTSQNNLAQGLNGDTSYTTGGSFGTGVIPSATSLGAMNGGITVYISVQEPDGTNHTHGGCNDNNANQFKFIYDFEFSLYTQSGNNGLAAATAGGIYAPFSGFVTVNAIPSPAGWLIAAYGNVNNVPMWTSLTSLTIDLGGGTTPSGTPPFANAFSWLDCAGSFQEFSAETLSFAAFHQGLTFAQAQALFNAVQAMRVSMGAGFI